MKVDLGLPGVTSDLTPGLDTMPRYFTAHLPCCGAPYAGDQISLAIKRTPIRQSMFLKTEW